MQILENISLKSFNTFGIDVKARYFAAFSNVEELDELLTCLPDRQAPDSGPAYRTGRLPTLILGGGSNILFIKDYDGLVLKNEVTGIEKINEDEDHVYIRAGAGENWHQFVLHCIENNRAGVENLSLIPGNVGAAPIQNIGAYGVELQKVFYELKAFHLKEKTNYTFGLKDCEFNYRDSIFKRKYKDEFAITSVMLRLNKKPVFNTSYGAVEQELEKMGVKDLSIKAISQAVINIRSSKLPDPAEIGNAGSFFKNPQIPLHEFRELKRKYPDMPSYPVDKNFIKIPAAWLIEQCGPDNPDGNWDGTSWKGYRKGDAGCHPKQALVLVNYGHAMGKEIYHLGEEIRESVKEKFGVLLEREVNLM